MATAIEFSATLFIIDDDVRLCEWVAFHLSSDNLDVEYFLNADTGLNAVQEKFPDVLILDLELPDLEGLKVLERIRRLRPELPVVMLTATEDVPTVVRAMNEGAFDYLTKPVAVERLLLVVRNALEKNRLQQQVADLQRSGRDAGTWGLVGNSPVMLELHRLIEQIATSNVSVLIQGESGTGKELVARAIHDASKRSGRPFIAVNCAAVLETLQEDEFFGHEKGAFTGASGFRRGRFERAHGGTLFLDEVGALSPSLQATLLRVLQERTFTRVGGSEEIESDFRLVAATNRDLMDAVAEDEFREDLFYRLAVFEVELPALRMRSEDIPELTSTFLREMAREAGAERESEIDAGALDVLIEHSWPGNVRELRNAVHRGFVASGGGTVRREHLPPRMFGSQEMTDGEPTNRGAMEPSESSSQRSRPSLLPVLDREDLDRIAVMQALRQSNGNVHEAALILGIGRTTLYRMRKRYGLL